MATGPNIKITCRICNNKGCPVNIKNKLDNKVLLKARQSQDALAIWKWATRLDKTGDHLSAINCYKWILLMDVKTILLHSEVKDKKEAFGIKNDARLRISQSYMDISLFKEALYWARQHITIRKRKYPSMYLLAEAQKIISGIKKRYREHRSAQKIWLTVEKKDWGQAEKLIMVDLKKLPNDPWLLSRLSYVFYKTKKYKQALKWGRKAYKIAPQDPLCLWDYAEALNVNECKNDAIRVYKKILNMGAYNAGCINTSEGLRWANMLINDSRYQIGLCYYKLNNVPLAKRWLRLYLKNRKLGTLSIPRSSEVLKKLMSRGKGK